MPTAVRREICVMNESGDTRLSWDEDNEVEVAAARKMFDDLKAKGYVGYAMDKKGEKGEVIRSFDPSLEKIVMAPQMRGG